MVSIPAKNNKNLTLKATLQNEITEIRKVQTKNVNICGK